MKTWESLELKEIDQVAQAVKANLDKYAVVLLYGDLGTGKTTFVQALCRNMGVEGDIDSPTFSLVNDYGTLFHFDLYRLKNAEELWDIGFEEYLDSGKKMLIEWPQLAATYIDVPHQKLSITHQAKGRNYSLELVD